MSVRLRSSRWQGRRVICAGDGRDDRLDRVRSMHPPDTPIAKQAVDSTNGIVDLSFVHEHIARAQLLVQSACPEITVRTVSITIRKLSRELLRRCTINRCCGTPWNNKEIRAQLRILDEQFAEMIGTTPRVIVRLPRDRPVEFSGI
jgi:hypothetical protein